MKMGSVMRCDAKLLHTRDQFLSESIVMVATSTFICTVLGLERCLSQTILVLSASDMFYSVIAVPRVQDYITIYYNLQILLTTEGNIQKLDLMH